MNEAIIAGIVIPLVIQAAALIWWASGINTLVKIHDERISKAEQSLLQLYRDNNAQTKW